MTAATPLHRPDDPIVSFLAAMSEAGISTKDKILADGTLHRFHIEGDGLGSRNGWYCLFLDGIAAGSFGSWKTGHKQKWCAKAEVQLTVAEREQFRQRMDAARRQREEEQARIRLDAAKTAASIWDSAGPSDGHPYLTKKGVRSYGVRWAKNSLVIPMRDINSELHSIQFIGADGQKLFLSGGRKSGCCHLIGTIDHTLIIAEGYATGATIHEATGHPVAVAFDAGNLRPVAEAWREKAPGLRIIIATDNDQWTIGNPGIEKAKAAAEAVGGSIIIPQFRDLAEKPTDFNDLARLEGLDSVRTRFNGASTGFEGFVGTGCGAFQNSGTGADWPEPLPLPASLPPVEAFKPSLLPQALRPLIMDIADRMQCPPDFPAISAMVALGSVVGRQIGIRPKQRDDWLVVPNLWGAVVGRPGVMKTPAIQEPMRPVRGLEIEAAEEHESSIAAWEAAQLVSKEAAKVTGEKIREALKKNSDPHAIARQFITEEAEEPGRRRYIVNDTTVEKLGEILKDNPRGTLLFRDELTGFLRSLDREGNESARAFFLEAWNGDGRFTYDRIGRGTIDIEAACVSVLGGIQPGPLSAYMASMARGGLGDDGLMQRFQMIAWPDVSGEWANVDREPSPEGRRAATEIFKRLDRLDPDAVGAIRSEDAAIPYLRFGDAAQELFNEWRGELERRVRSGDEHPAMEAHLSKYRSLVPSLALLCHLADCGTGDVSLDAMTRAAAWAEYLESHAQRVYASATNPSLTAAHILGRHLKAGDLGKSFSARDVYLKGWSGLSGPEEVTAATAILIDLRWLKPEQVSSGPSGGRPTIVYHPSPRLTEAKL
jgi:putative DNA primase/helicase